MNERSDQTTCCLPCGDRLKCTLPCGRKAEVTLETWVEEDEANWKSPKFRDGMVCGAAVVLLPIFLWVVIHG